MSKIRRAAASVLVFSAFVLTACRFPAGITEPLPSPPPEAEATLEPAKEPAGAEMPSSVPDGDSGADDGRYASTKLYYVTDEGYLLPVSARIPWEDGIAKACLGRLIADRENRNALMGSGLNAPIPEGTRLSLAVTDGEARLDLIGMPALPDAESERLLFAAIVNTLTEFRSIDRVTVLMDGSSAATAHGVTPPAGESALPLNVENAEVAVSGSAKPLTLYFPNRTGSHFIPVTRYVSGSAGLGAAVSALVSGTALPGLIPCFPEGTLMLGAAIENGLLTIDLSADFMKVADTPGLYSLAMHSALLTAMPYGSVDEVRFLVNGAPFEPDGR